MGNDRDFASAMGDAALFNHDATGFTGTRSEPHLDRVHAEVALPRQKTNIEMAVERRQQLQVTRPSGLTGSTNSRPTAPAAAATPTVDQVASSFAESVSSEADVLRPQEAGHVSSGPDTATPASMVADTVAREPDSALTLLQPVHELAPSARSSNAKTLAAAAIVLLIGTSIGYIASKSAEPTGARTIESSGDGVKLRLDSDLRQR